MYCVRTVFIIKLMTKYRRLVMTIAAVLCLQLPAIGQPAAAQAMDEEQSISKSALAVSPAIIEEVLTPGEPTSFTLQVHNVTNFPLPIKGFVKNLNVQSEELEKTDKERLDASQWFVIEEPDFILQPDQLRTVKGIIQTPADATPGGHYATIYFQPLVPEEALSPAMAYVNAKVGVLAFLIVKGDIEQKAELAEPLHTTGLVRHGPIKFTFAIRNTGNVHLMPTARLMIYDVRGRKVETLKTPIGLTLPNSTKQYTVEWKGGSRLGKYRAELVVSYGPENTELPKTTANFWIMPWIEILTISLLIAGIVWFVRKTRRRWRRTWKALRRD